MWPDSERLVFGAEEHAELEVEGRLLHPDPLVPEDLARCPALREAEVLFTSWGAPRLDEALLAEAPRLRAVFHAAGSVKAMVTPGFWDREIVLCSAASMNAVPVAEYTFACIILGLKHGVARAAAQRVPTAPWWGQPPSPGAYGTTVGLVSLGVIGRLVLERLRSLEVRVLAYDPFIADAEARALGVERVSLEDLFVRADAVSLHTPLLPETVHLVRGRHLASMRSGATFINTARGAIVNEIEMVDVLRTRPDLQVFLDVTDPEPPAADSPLRGLPNVFLTPHLSGSQGQECRRLGRAMVREFGRWRRGDPLVHQLNESQVSTMA